MWIISMEKMYYERKGETLILSKSGLGNMKVNVHVWSLTTKNSYVHNSFCLQQRFVPSLKSTTVFMTVIEFNVVPLMVEDTVKYASKIATVINYCYVLLEKSSQYNSNSPLVRCWIREYCKVLLINYNFNHTKPS